LETWPWAATLATEARAANSEAGRKEFMLMVVLESRVKSKSTR
jgi:hypothetical protein